MMAVYTVSIIPLPTNLGAFSGKKNATFCDAVHI